MKGRHPFESYRCGEDGLEGWVERRNKALPFLWHKRWAVLQPRSSSQPAHLLFYKKSIVRSLVCHIMPNLIELIFILTLSQRMQDPSWRLISRGWLYCL
jgi:hypothetical protein